MIRNVTAVYSEAAGCAIGSEMSGGMENITVRYFPLACSGIGLKLLNDLG